MTGSGIMILRILMRGWGIILSGGIQPRRRPVMADHTASLCMPTQRRRATPISPNTVLRGIHPKQDRMESCVWKSAGSVEYAIL